MLALGGTSVLLAPMQPYQEFIWLVPLMVEGCPDWMAPCY